MTDDSGTPRTTTEVITVRRVAALLNPASRHGLGAATATRAVAALRNAGLEVYELIGDTAEHARQLATKAMDSGLDAVVVVGGDGSVALALAAARGRQTPIGIMPAGSGNDLAREFGIPATDLGDAAQVIAGGRVRTMDVGVATTADGTESVFATVAATGLDALVTEQANQMSWPKGQARYVLAALKGLSKFDPFDYRVTIDGELITEQLAMASIGNTRYYGGGMAIAPAADPDDGLLDVTLIRASSKWRGIAFFPRIFKGTHVDLPDVITKRGKVIRLESTPTALAYADGEKIGDLPITVTIDPAAVRLLVP